MSIFHELSQLASVWNETLGKPKLSQCLSKRGGVLISALLFCTDSELSCKSLEGQEGLRQLIFQVTCNMKDVGSTIGCQRLAGRLVGTSLSCLKPAGPASHLPEHLHLPLFLL